MVIVKRKKRYNVLIDFKIDEELLKSLDLFAKEKVWSRSFVIREAIKKYIKTEKGREAD